MLNMLYMLNWYADGMYGWTISLYDCKTHRRISNKMYRSPNCSGGWTWVNCLRFPSRSHGSFLRKQWTSLFTISSTYINWRYPSCVGLCKGYVRECKAVTLSIGIVLLFLEASSWHAAICTSWSTGPKLGGSSGLAASPVCLGRKLQSHPSWIWYFSHMVCLGESFCASRVN